MILSGQGFDYLYRGIMAKSKREMIAESPTQVVEEMGIGFDPNTQPLDLSKDEKRRMTSVMLAIQLHRDMMIKEADYLREVINISRTDASFTPRPASVDAVIMTSLKIDAFISNDESYLGKYARTILGEAENPNPLAQDEVEDNSLGQHSEDAL